MNHGLNGSDKNFFSNWRVTLRHEPSDLEIEQAAQYSPRGCSLLVCAIALFVRDVFADNEDLQEIHVVSREHRTDWDRNGNYRLRFAGPTTGCDQDTGVLFDDLWNYQLPELNDRQGFSDVPNATPRIVDDLPF